MASGQVRGVRQLDAGGGGQGAVPGTAPWPPPRFLSHPDSSPKPVEMEVKCGVFISCWARRRSIRVCPRLICVFRRILSEEALDLGRRWICDSAEQRRRRSIRVTDIFVLMAPKLRFGGAAASSSSRCPHHRRPHRASRAPLSSLALLILCTA